MVAAVEVVVRPSTKDSVMLCIRPRRDVSMGRRSSTILFFFFFFFFKIKMLSRRFFFVVV